MDETPPVPAGTWVLLPAEPTREMWAASGDAINKFGHRLKRHHDCYSTAVWEAMKAAAPSPMVDDCPSPKGCVYCAQFGCPRLGPMVERIDEALLAADEAIYRAGQMNTNAVIDVDDLRALISADRSPRGKEDQS